jgi:hypothetical protein
VQRCATEIKLITVLPAFIAPRPTARLLKSHYIIHSYNVKTSDSIVMFRVEEKFIPHKHHSLLHRKIASDAASNHLFALRTKSFSPGPTYFSTRAGKKGQGKKAVQGQKKLRLWPSEGRSHLPECQYWRMNEILHTWWLPQLESHDQAPKWAGNCEDRS